MPTRKDTHLNVRISRELKVQAAACAKAEFRTLGELVNEFLAKYVESRLRRQARLRREEDAN